MPEQIAEVLDQFDQLLGPPQDDAQAESSARIVVALREAGNKLVQEWGQKLAELPVRLIEAPEFRLAGAEEAIRQMVASLEQVLQHHEPLARELSTRAAEMHQRLMALASPSAQTPSSAPRRSGLFRKVTSGSRKNAALTELHELLHSYAKTLYQSLLLSHAGELFLTLRGHLADEMREINFCRVRLGELLRMLEEPPEAPDANQVKSAVLKHFYPAGCKDFTELVAHFEGRLTDAQVNELDVKMEAMLKKHFTALVNVCLTSGTVLKNVEDAMRRTAEEFVAAQLGELNVAEMFLQQYDDTKKAAEQIASLFEEAAPQLPHTMIPPQKGGQAVELCVLSAPAGPAGERLRALAAETLPDVEWQAAAGDEDILLYRERANLAMDELPQLGALAQDAYRQMSNAENFTPHCRCDVEFTDGNSG